MGEILFRGKRLNNGEWAVGYLEKCPPAIQMPGYGGPWYIRVPPQDPDDNGGFYNIDPETVGEYTGKKDKTENRIFEGDILAFNPGDGEETSHYLVRWDNARWTVCTGRGYADDEMIDWESEYWTVIGNIYDNPELMEVT